MAVLHVAQQVIASAHRLQAAFDEAVESDAFVRDEMIAELVGLEELSSAVFALEVLDLQVKSVGGMEVDSSGCLDVVERLTV